MSDEIKMKRVYFSPDYNQIVSLLRATPEDKALIDPDDKLDIIEHFDEDLGVDIHDRVIYKGEVGFVRLVHKEERTALVDFFNGSRKILEIKFLEKMEG